MVRRKWCKYNEGVMWASHKQYRLAICTNPKFSRSLITPPLEMCCDKCPGFTPITKATDTPQDDEEL